MKQVNMPYKFISDVDLDNNKFYDIKKLKARNSLLGIGEIDCICRHFRAWNTFLESSDQFAIILEDDIHISSSFSDIIRSIQLPENLTFILKIETFFLPVSVKRDSKISSQCTRIYKLLSPHAGSAGYLINRKTAQFLISESSVITNAIDIELFFPRRRKIPYVLNYQLVPALCAQHERMSKEGISYLRTGIGNDRADKRREKTILGSLNLIIDNVRSIFEPIYAASFNGIIRSFGYSRIVVEIDK